MNMISALSFSNWNLLQFFISFSFAWRSKSVIKNRINFYGSPDIRIRVILVQQIIILQQQIVILCLLSFKVLEFGFHFFNKFQASVQILRPLLQFFHSILILLLHFMSNSFFFKHPISMTFSLSFCKGILDTCGDRILLSHSHIVEGVLVNCNVLWLWTHCNLFMLWVIVMKIYHTIIILNFS